MPSNTYTITDVNGETGIIVERQPTADELAQMAIDEAAAETAKVKIATEATARQSILDRLGLTSEEVQLLLGGN